MNLRRYKPAIAIVLVVFFTPTFAHAYIDPGTLSVALQAIVGAVVGVFIAVKMYWTKIRYFIKNIFGK